MNAPKDTVEIPATKHALLEENFIGMMTTVRHKDGMLSTNPVGYVWDGKQIRVSTLKSRVKYQNLLADDRICFCVTSPKNVMDYIEIRGVATLQDDPDRSFHDKQFRRGSGGMEPPKDMDPPGAERVTITIHPTQVSSPTLYGGRFDNFQPGGKN